METQFIPHGESVIASAIKTAQSAGRHVAGILTDFRLDNIHPFDGCPAAFLDYNDTDAPTA